MKWRACIERRRLNFARSAPRWSIAGIQLLPISEELALIALIRVMAKTPSASVSIVPTKNAAISFLRMVQFMVIRRFGRNKGKDRLSDW
jgi:hypothetical protein